MGLSKKKKIMIGGATAANIGCWMSFWRWDDFRYTSRWGTSIK